MRLVADHHYNVRRYGDMDARRGQIKSLVCRWCQFSVGVVALHRAGDKSGAARYCRARAIIVKHIHTEHPTEAAAVNVSMVPLAY